MSVAINKELFETMPIPKAVATMCVPGIFSTIVTTLYTFADTYFVSLLNDPTQSGAVALAAGALYVNMAISSLFGMGSASYFSRMLGKNDYKEARKASVSGIYWAILFGGLVSILYALFSTPVIRILGGNTQRIPIMYSYLFWTLLCGSIPSVLNVVMANLFTAEGLAKHAGIGTMLGCMLNIILDPLFVLPQFLGMGVEGAALATFLSNCVAVTYFTILLFRKRETILITMNPKEFRPNWRMLRNICVVGIPTAVQSLTFVVNSIVRNNIIASYGDVATAAYGISYKIAMIPVSVIMGTALGIVPLLGYSYSAGNADRMKATLRFTLKLCILGAAACVVIVLAAPSFWMRLFIQVPEVIDVGSVFLKISAITIIIMVADLSLTSVFQACGKGKAALLLPVAKKAVFEIPLMILFNRLLPVYGFAFGEPFAELAISVCAIYLVRRLFFQMRELPPLKCGSQST